RQPSRSPRPPSNRVIPRSRTASSLSTPQSFVIPADALGVLGRHGIAIDRNQGVGRFAAAHLLGDPVAKLHKGFSHKLLELSPIRHFRVPPDILARPADPVANPRGFPAPIGVVQQLLDVAHAVGPLTKSFTGDRSSRAPSEPFGHAIEPEISLPAGTTAWLG